MGPQMADGNIIWPIQMDALEPQNVVLEFNAQSFSHFPFLANVFRPK